MVTFIFTKEAERTFKSLDKIDQNRITNKLGFLKKHEDIFSVLKKLVNFEPATHRLRIGRLRIILELVNQKKNAVNFYVLDIGYRKDIYG